MLSLSHFWLSLPGSLSSLLSLSLSNSLALFLSLSLALFLSLSLVLSLPGSLCLPLTPWLSLSLSLPDSLWLSQHMVLATADNATTMNSHNRQLKEKHICSSLLATRVLLLLLRGGGASVSRVALLFAQGKHKQGRNFFTSPLSLSLRSCVYFP
jgi:hypothetical protein